MKTGFFAYSSALAHIEESIEASIKKINDSSNANVKSWKSLKISGKLLINPILNSINEADFVCVDLTGMNNNVLFELGYSVAKDKPLFLIHDDSIIDSKKKFKELNFLTTVGYCSYNNSADIVHKFYSEDIINKEEGLFETLAQDISDTGSKEALFYLKGQVDTSYSQIVTNILSDKSLPHKIDDPSEGRVQPLSWYIKYLRNIPALLAEFSGTHRSGYEIQNMKCSFISGLALGMDKRVLMIAEVPYETPLDYKELLIKFKNEFECREAVEPFISELKNDIAELFFKKKNLIHRRKRISKLQSLNFGEYIAEHEINNLYGYYIENVHYKNILKSEHNIVIGRKGTGKTATLYYARDVLSENKKDHVCLIKPINFEIEGLTILLTSLKDEFEKGFLIEAIWKFLIYSEIAKSIYDDIKKKRPHELEQVHFDFVKFVDKNESIIKTDFSTRLEQQINNLEQIESEGQRDFRVKVSEVLHQGILSELRDKIKGTLSEKERIIVLIDNIDKSWRKGSNLRVLSRYILGLLGVVGRISKDFRVSGNENVGFGFHLTLFLRSDIFQFIMESAREPDKIEYTKLNWTDQEIFFRIIEERIELLSEYQISREDFWENYIVDHVGGEKIREFIIQRIFPRPRDIIYLFNSAKNIAVSRGHEVIVENDILLAYDDYSSWVFKSILVENGITIKEMEDFLYELVGGDAIVSKENIILLMGNAGLNNSDEHVDKFISHLESLTVIGPEVRENEFKFNYDFENSKKIEIQAKKYGSNRFRIHNALIPFLECKI